MPKKILVPTDFTDVSRAALKEAVAVARDCSAELIVLYADQFVPPLDAGIELPQNFIGLSDEKEKEVATTYLRQKIDEIVPRDVPATPVVVIDSPVDAILTVAREHEVDWIVMGTHGRTGVKRVFQGSVTEEVVRRSDRPVLAVHNG